MKDRKVLKKDEEKKDVKEEHWKEIRGQRKGKTRNNPII